MLGNNATVLPLRDYRRARRTLYFTRSELNQLLGLYSRNVARGIWRDYAIDHRDGQALFSVFAIPTNAPPTRSSNPPLRRPTRSSSPC